ncbi:histidine--tRNA ligase [Candidatus Roizmanbacteria bacterium RIFCSPHIGHO2_02_FULL_37_15]|uniref:Histidine--tRNA ligase n=1 Tax=Candidatus Roizmanbacteria bacterium RIFCSPLOWO2_01_FULL_37_16 TaxID=1802058 RepID=A0A1F7IQF6_9BACT|nr:MAG: histidine--tRNA ligase [Candidatus Roizmanbacteria bacterium RIFCSPHIGHO2_01_FULL_37_16b]OGK21122.1 MAG: histidine--tRNA ligase [Candidatus Roizmanbacteria bacterium RIFCSPHIGHO2_02_FULL_37_15]OGK31480.1 MAG: histidine--tRNA ligase [Candidatus Roizmanbacteria bacterium RIFCSPHIGHO2_12_FULL_36_11]OGK45600.1 MAG: histidine--tRNA ligase [Candidatus Roizmanbacteria bacterium RIFCSPLOWO2_01_FULL_37_16]OGK55997.1 MAG: histidine--tRNA ligase [Candidatus Roizmanbacteria bacterium RIFCSPLOWO2_02
MIKNILKPQTLKGFRDFLPTEKRKRDLVAQKVKEIFELFGYEPLETPTLEYASLLLGKYGKEADKLLYRFRDSGGREVALRYDQTVPTARVLAQYQSALPKFFKRYQIQNVYRADKPQRGRFREFTQCDIDIFNSTSPIADAEIVATTYFAFQNVGYPKIKILINDRQTLFRYLEPFTNSNLNIFSLIQSIDKLEKIGNQRVIEELIKKGLDESQAQMAINSITEATLSKNLAEIIKTTILLGVPKRDIIFSSSLARGLDYYTGMIFEVVLPGYAAGSCGGGGRYDKLIEQLGGDPTPAVGIAFGFDRMVEAAEYFKIISQETRGTQALVTVFDQITLKNSLKLTSELRKNKIKTEVSPTIEKLDKQLKYADKKGIQFVVIIGPEEVKKNVLKLKNMKTGEQKELSESELIKFLISNYSN